MKNYITFILGKIYYNTQVFYKNIFDKNNKLRSDHKYFWHNPEIAWSINPPPETCKRWFHKNSTRPLVLSCYSLLYCFLYKWKIGVIDKAINQFTRGYFMLVLNQNARSL